MKLSIISCIDKNCGIGYQNKLLAHMPNDLTRFKELTLNKNCVMGRKTYESIVSINGEPLKDRDNIVLTSDKDYIPPKSEGRVKVENDIFELVKTLNFLDLQYSLMDQELEVMICGGSVIYKQLMPYADTIYLTIIHHEFKKVDSYFPKFSLDEWEVSSSVHHLADNKNPYDYSFVTYKRKMG